MTESDFTSAARRLSDGTGGACQTPGVSPRTAHIEQCGICLGTFPGDMRITEEGVDSAKAVGHVGDVVITLHLIGENTLAYIHIALGCGG